MKIAHITDLHLHGDIGVDSSYQQFMSCLMLALAHNAQFLLLTGDLVEDGVADGYQWLLDCLHQTQLPFVCLAGNHDVTYTLGHHLPYDQRTFLPKAAHPMLATHQNVPLGSYQLLCLDSTVAGKEYGLLNTHTLAWLHDTLSQNQKPTLIAMHHPPILVGAQWIDALALQNSTQFWQTLQPHTHVKAIICGHVHQAHRLKHQGIWVFTSPSSYRQFLPFCDTFALDTQAPGIRIITLNAALDSFVVRLAHSF